MPRVVFIASDGRRIDVDAPDGMTLMRAAVENNVPGIDGDCGGACACATCHVHVAEEWLSALPAAKSGETDLLEFALETTAASRLGCQIVLSAALNGLVVTVPKAQI